MISLNFDYAMYQTIAIFKKSPGLLGSFNYWKQVSTRDSAKVILFKFRKLSCCIIWNKLLLHGWFKQGMPLAKEVVKLIKNYNWFKLCYI